MLLKDFDLIIFDLDGVLIDSKKFWLYIHQRALAEQGYHYSFEEIEPYLGQKTKKIVSELIPKGDEGREKKIKRAQTLAYKLSYQKEALEKVNSLPYAKETIKELKRRGYNLALLTNSNRFFVDTIFKKFSLRNCWKKIIAAGDGFEKKEEAILFLIDHFNTKPKRTVYIGDMLRDIKIARKVGCKIISIPGWDSKETLREAKLDCLIDSLKELI